MRTWEEASEAALNKIMQTPNDDFARWPMEALYEKGAWESLAKRAATLLEAAGEYDSEEFLTLLAGKQHDYGTENILKFGQLGIKVRLWDKLARLKNVEARGARPKNEARLDTLRDVIGYVVVNVMLEETTAEGIMWFLLPLAADLQDAA